MQTSRPLHAVKRLISFSPHRYGNHIENIRQAVKNICRRIFNHLVVISGVRAAPTLDTCDDEPPVVLSEAYREPKLPDAYFLVRAVLERFAVVWRVAPRRGDDFIELVEYPVLVGRGQSVEVVFGRRGEFPRPPVVTHRSCRTARGPPRRSSFVPRGCLPRLRGAQRVRRGRTSGTRRRPEACTG